MTSKGKEFRMSKGKGFRVHDRDVLRGASFYYVS